MASSDPGGTAQVGAPSNGFMHWVALAAVAQLGLACSSTTFVSSWRSPTAQPLGLQGEKVAAVVMTRDEASRRTAEDTLAREISKHGAQGVPMYSIAPGSSASADDEAATRAALEAAHVVGVVVMRPLRVDRNIVIDPAPYAGPAYAGYWGGYYAYGWGSPWGPTPVETHTDVVVSVETLVYSLKQNALVWAGRSKTSNPSNLDHLITEVASGAADELQAQGLVAR